MKMKTNKIVTVIVAIALCVAFSCISVFADNAVLKSVGGTVEMDGTNVNTVSVSISASTDMVLQLIQGVFSTTESEGTGYLKLVDISSDQIVFDGVNYAYDVNTGELVWMDDSYAGLSFAQNAPVLVAKYEVAANTPAGNYTVEFANEVIADGDWNEYYDSFSFTITVTTAASEPACEHTSTKAVSNGDGATHKLVCTNEACNGYVVAPSVKCSGGTATCVAKAVCAECGQSYGELGNHAYGELIPAQEKIHSESTLQAPVAAHYHCVCGTYFTEAKVETTLAALTGEEPVHAHAYYYYNAEKHQSRCICGYNLMFDMQPHVDENADEKCDVCTYPMHTCANKLTYVPAATANCSKNGNIEYWYCADEECGKYYSDANATTEITDKTTVVTTAPNDHKYGDLATGWYQIGSDWYYGEYRVCDNNAAHVDHTPVTGIKRVPYPTKPIEGFTYAPNAEDVAYAESKGNTFIDKDEAWFIFGEDGKFQSSENGKIEGPYATCYAVNGMIPWHYGLAKIANKYYYFVGDTVNGGNKVADGPVWVTRTNGVTGLDTTVVNCYYFLGGVLANNLTDIVDGKYYENGKLMMGAGLVKIEEGKYIYVRSNGQLAKGVYYVYDETKYGKSIKYEFDENGFCSGVKNGIIDGFYYIDGHIAYGKGVVEMTDEEGETYYIYVKSNGQLATGKYWPTTRNGYLESGEYDWGTDGKYYPAK